MLALRPPSPPQLRSGYMPLTKFGITLKRLREQRGLTQVSLGEKAGLSHVAVGDWERGKRNPKRPNVVAIVAALEVDEDELMAAAGFTVGSNVVAERSFRYVTDPSTARLVEAYEGLPESGKRMIESAAKLAEEYSREGAIGGRRADDDDNPAQPE